MKQSKKFKIIGTLLLAWLAAVTINRFQVGLQHNLWWVSHATLLLAAIGFIQENKHLLTASLCLVFIPHLFWIIDVILLLAGAKTFGVGDYLQYGDINTYIFTIHHVFLIPILLWALHKTSVSNKGWMIATSYFATITLAALLTTPPEYNVNCAWHVCEATIAKPFYFINQLPQIMYWMIENLIATTFMFIPINSMLKHLYDKTGSLITSKNPN